MNRARLAHGIHDSIRAPRGLQNEPPVHRVGRQSGHRQQGQGLKAGRRLSRLFGRQV